MDDMTDGMNKKHDWGPSMVSFLDEVLSRVEVIDLTSRPLDPYLPLSLFIELERERESREGVNEFQQVLNVLPLTTFLLGMLFKGIASSYFLFFLSSLFSVLYRFIIS